MEERHHRLQKKEAHRKIPHAYSVIGENQSLAAAQKCWCCEAFNTICGNQYKTLQKFIKKDIFESLKRPLVFYGKNIKQMSTLHRK